MELKEFLKKQRKLDDYILENQFQMSYVTNEDHKAFLPQRLLALQVEVSELANATRAFKYWSTKEPESKERILDEYVDVLHFYLSIGNTLDLTAEEIEKAYEAKYQENIKRQQTGY